MKQKSRPKSFAFVLMPFEDKFDDIYKLGIKAACEDCNIYCERVDEQIFQESILDRIYNQINKADYIISDLSQKNVNVFYETGYAHASRKNVLLLTNNAENIPFDLKHYPHIIYDSITDLKCKLEKKLEWFEEEDKVDENNEYLEFIKPLYEGTDLRDYDEEGIKVKKEISFLGSARGGLDDERIKIPITIQSNLKKVTNLNSYQFGLIHSVEYLDHIAFDENRIKSEVIKMDKSKIINLVQCDRKIFPESLLKLNFILRINSTDHAFSTIPDYQEVFQDPIKFTFRIYSLIGFEDFEFKVRLDFEEIW